MSKGIVDSIVDSATGADKSHTTGTITDSKGNVSEVDTETEASQNDQDAAADAEADSDKE